ncbi:MAG: hypothetical protein LLF83_05350 [Methanobacterium sp.]|nr:hypothetical protein [Methanobacterium sp.]
MNKLQVKIVENGFSEENNKYYVTYQVKNLDTDIINKLINRLEDPAEIRGDHLYITIFFEEEFYPFKSEESHRNPEDFLAREELEMTAYLIDLLED